MFPAGLIRSPLLLRMLCESELLRCTLLEIMQSFPILITVPSSRANSMRLSLRPCNDVSSPIMIVFLAVVVGGVVLSVIIPMFSLYGQIS